MDAQRDHIFISYASEDAALAEWLARKLTAAGYGVWMDRLKLLGGDRWPKEIDEAIKERSHCLVQLITTAALTKDNPGKERQLALYLETERKRTFFIPLNVEGIPPPKLPWQMSDIQYIAFQDWAAGLSGLLATLDKTGCPKLWGGDGSALVIRSYFPERAVRPVPEKIYTNCYPVMQLPEVVQRYKSRGEVKPSAVREWATTVWPCYYVNGTTVLSFQPPPSDVAKAAGLERKGGVCWQAVEDIDGVAPYAVAIHLVKAAFHAVCHVRHLLTNASPFYWYFPADAVSSDGDIRFRCYTGKDTWIRVRGTRTVRGQPVQYALAFVPFVRSDIGDGFTVQIKIRLRLADRFGVLLDGKLIPSRRKHVTAAWWNHEWLLRQEAIMAHLSQGRDLFAWGHDGKACVTFSAVPIQGESPTSLDDDYLATLKIAGKSEAQIRDEAAEQAEPLADNDHANQDAE